MIDTKRPTSEEYEAVEAAANLVRPLPLTGVKNIDTVECIPSLRGTFYRVTFITGIVASVVSHDGSYGNEFEWEIMELADVPTDPEGWLDTEGVIEVLKNFSEQPPRRTDFSAMMSYNYTPFQADWESAP